VLHVGRVEKSRLHLDASIGGGRRFDTVIILSLQAGVVNETPRVPVQPEVMAHFILSSFDKTICFLYTETDFFYGMEMRHFMNFIDKMERKFGRFGISNLMLYLIIFYLLGWFVQLKDANFYWNYLSLNMDEIFNGQVWRLVSFLMYPPSTSILWLALLSFIYYSLANSLERVMGTFRFNLFLLLGFIGTILAALIIYLGFGQVYLLTADQIYMSMLLCIAATFPETKFYLYFVIPVKAKWLGWLYGAILIYQVITSNWPGRIAIVLSLLNFIVYFCFLKKPVQRAQAMQRRARYEAKVRKAQAAHPTHHRCAICGITDEDDPNMEFRYCSKCDGGREYCREHLYTHMHYRQDNSSQDQ